VRQGSGRAGTYLEVLLLLLAFGRVGEGSQAAEGGWVGWMDGCGRGALELGWQRQELAGELRALCERVSQRGKGRERLGKVKTGGRLYFGHKTRGRLAAPSHSRVGWLGGGGERELTLVL
jgi:hypothetical protein